MSPEEYRVAQDRFSGAMTAATFAILSNLPFKRLTPTQWTKLVRSLLPSLIRLRLQSHSLAEVFYASQSPAGTAPSVPISEYRAEYAVKALRRFEVNLADPVRAPSAASQGGRALGRHVDQAGREMILAATAADVRGVRWARMDPRPPTCAFCALTISRGPVFHSSENDSGGFLSHDGCTCVPVPVFPGKDWAGREQYEAAEEFYVRHAAGAGPGRQIAAMRAAIIEHGSPI